MPGGGEGSWGEEAELNLGALWPRMGPWLHQLLLGELILQYLLLKAFLSHWFHFMDKKFWQLLATIPLWQRLAGTRGAASFQQAVCAPRSVHFSPLGT